MNLPILGKRTMLALKLSALLMAAFLIFYRLRLAPVKVQACEVGSGTVVNEVMGTGTLEAKVGSSISPKISGLLVKVLVDQNDRVAKGQLLAELDDGDLRQQVEVAKADLVASKATIERIGADIAGARASAAKARADFERASTLLKSRVVAENEMERASEARDVAEANLSRALLSKTEAERVAGRAEATLSFYNERLKDTRLCAPFDGLVLRRNRNPGDVVVPGSSILDMVSTEMLWVSAWVDETAMGSLAADQPARVVFRSCPETSFKGRVVRLASETDRETREFIVDVGVSKLPDKWAIGQRAEVYIETGRREGVVAIPQRFILWREGQAGVMIDKGGRARWQKISIGLKGRENVEITAGLSAGQIVVGPLPGTEPPPENRAIRYDKP